MTTSALSTRGKRASDTPLRVDHGLFQEAVGNLYHPIENPNGALPLNVAENRLSWLDLKAKIEAGRRALPSRTPDGLPH
jgi:1-aminocyclopropane-1-carboxylate synthase